jgi:hypothetical protein
MSEWVGEWVSDEWVSESAVDKPRSTINLQEDPATLNTERPNQFRPLKAYKQYLTAYPKSPPIYR